MKLNEIQIKKGVWANAFFLFVACFLTIYGAFRIKDNQDFYYLTMLGCLIIIPQKGIQLDFSQNRFQEYVSIFGLKMGVWKNLAEFNAVSILQVKRRFSLFQFAGNMPTNKELTISKYVNYNVVLLSNNHRKKIVLKEFYSEEKAKKLANSIALNSSFQYEKYNPTLSAISKAKRQKGRL